MSLSILPNQALAQKEDITGKCNAKYLLPSQRADAFTLQGLSTGSNNVELTNSGDYSAWTLGAGFNNGGPDHLLYDGSQGSPANALSSPLNLLVGKIYYFRIYVTVNNAGTCSATQGIQLYINDEAIPLP